MKEVKPVSAFLGKAMAELKKKRDENLKLRRSLVFHCKYVINNNGTLRCIRGQNPCASTGFCLLGKEGEVIEQ